MANMRTRELLGQLIGNMFEEPKLLVRAERGPRGGDKGYLIGNIPVATRRIGSLRKQGFLNGTKPTEHAILWYQNSLQDEGQ